MRGRTRAFSGFLPATLCCLAANAGAALAADLPVKAPFGLLPNIEMTSQGWTATFASEIRYYSWAGDVGFAPRNAPENVRGGGSQLYIPFALQISGKPHEDFKFEILGRGGWVDSRQTTPGLSGAVSTFTDTAISATTTYFGFNGVQPFVSLNGNIPTGRSSLSGAQANARMDPDLVEIGSFGEGWNVGPTVGVNVPLTANLIWTTSAGYTWRGPFNREDSLAPTDPTVQTASNVDPGDVFTVTSSVGYQNGAFAGMISGTVSWETATTENGMALYRPGTRDRLTGTWSYPSDDFGVTTLSAAAAHSERNEVLFLAATALATEPFNTNSNLYRVGLEHLFPLGQLWMGPVASYLHRDRNSYDSGTLQFVPAKTRLSAGVVARMAVGDTVTFNARAEHVWTRQNEDPAPGDQRASVLAGGSPVVGIPVPVVSSKGWQFAFGANVRY